MEQNNQQNFNVVTTTKSPKRSKKSLIIGALIVLFLAISIPAGVYLVRQQQDVREKAQEALLCPAVEACPVAGNSTLLKSCYSVASGGSPRELNCSAIANVGTTAFCGDVEYCCSSLGASWTTDLTLCTKIVPSPFATSDSDILLDATPTSSASASPTTTASASASPTSSASSTPISTSTTTGSSTATAKSTSTASSSAIPVTGVNWPTLLGIGVGILVIVGSVLLVI